MKTRLLCFFMMLALSAAVQINAQTVANITGVFPNTNVLYSFPALGFAQGTCNDGTNIYLFATTGMGQKDAQYHNTGPHNNSPAAGLAGFPQVHLGDPDYYQGYIYAPLESAVSAPQGAASIDIGIFTTPAMARYAAISISNYQREVSAVCIDPVFSNSVALFATSFMSVSTNDGIYEYNVNNLTNLAFVRALPMTQHIRYMQGIICVGGMLYVMGDNKLAGEMYQVNPTNGGVVHLAELNIPGEGEWEGLDYFHGFLVANEGRTGTANWFDFFGAPATGRRNISATNDILQSVTNPSLQNLLH